jgi:hypothetical protein
VSQRTRRQACWSSLNNSAQTAPNFWLNPRNSSVSYPLVVQTPTYTINIDAGHCGRFRWPAAAGKGQLLMNIAKFGRARAAGDVAIEHPPGVRRERRRAGPRPEQRRRSAIDKVINATGAAAAIDDVVTLAARSRPCGKAFPACSPEWGWRWCWFSADGDQFPELARSADRADGGAVCAGGRDVDAVSDANASQRAGADGHADVHRPDDGQQHSGGDVRQRADGGGR